MLATIATNWELYAFEFQGVKFISRVNLDSTFGKRISQLPENVFIELNKNCISDLIGNIENMTREELGKEIERLNANNANNAILELA